MLAKRNEGEGWGADFELIVVLVFATDISKCTHITQISIRNAKLDFH